MIEKIEAKPYEWDIQEDNSGTVIRSFCLDKNSESVLLRIHNYSNYVFLSMPLCKANGLPYSWNKSKMSDVYNDIHKRCREDLKPLGFEFKRNRKLYYWDNCKLYPMMKIYFRSVAGTNALRDMLRKPFRTSDYGFFNLPVHENEVSIVRKFLTNQNLKFSDWLEATGELVPDDEKISKCKREYIINKWKTTTPISYDVCKDWVVYPKIMAFDIECYSQNSKVMPRKELTTDVSWMISCIVQRLGDKSTRKRYGIVLGECNDIPEGKFSNCEIIRVKNGDEIEMIKEFAKLINKEDPEIITGYNIMSFDYPYLNHRLKRCGEIWKTCGRIEREKTVYNEFTWQSSGYGHNKVGFLTMPGRISLDLLPIVKRDFSRFDQYTLNFVSNYFGIGKKNDVSPQEMFKIYENMRDAQIKFELLYKEEYELDVDVNYDSKNKSYYELLLEKNFTSEEFDEARKDYEEAKEDVTKVLEYCIQDSELVVDLFEKINVWVGSVELSNIVGVTIFELTTKGQQVRCISQLFDLCAKQHPRIVLIINPASGLHFNGGSVGKPIPGVYDNCLCFDFASLYPSIIQAYNICYTTLVHPDDKSVRDEDCHIIEFDQEEPIDGVFGQYDAPDHVLECDKYQLFIDGEEKKKKTVTKHYRMRFYKHKEGVLPALVRNLVSERRATQKIQEQYENTNPFLYMVLEKKQLALKVSGNSFFGFLGVSKNGKAPLIEAAMSITAMGRALIGRVNSYLTDKYDAKVVYGDTDSSMIDLGIKDSKDCQYWGVKISQELSGVRKGQIDENGDEHLEDKMGIFHDRVLKLEFEKAMRLFCLKSKKYFAFLIEKDGSFKMKKDKNGKPTDQYDSMKKGIVLARRDNFPYLKEIYEKVILSIMLAKGFRETTNIIVNGINDLYEGRIGYRKFTSTRALNSNYKSASCAMKIFGDELKIAGKIVNPGDRLEYVVVKNDQETLVGKKMKLTEQYLESLETETPYELDYEYYVEKGLMNPITQLYEFGYQKEHKVMSEICYKKKDSTANPIKLHQIIKMLCTAKREGRDLFDIRDCILSCYEHFFGENGITFDRKYFNVHHFKDEDRYKHDLEKERIKNEKKVKKTVVRSVVKIPQIKGQSKITRFLPMMVIKKN